MSFAGGIDNANELTAESDKTIGQMTQSINQLTESMNEIIGGLGEMSVGTGEITEALANMIDVTSGVRDSSVAIARQAYERGMLALAAFFDVSVDFRIGHWNAEEQHALTLQAIAEKPHLIIA